MLAEKTKNIFRLVSKKGENIKMKISVRFHIALTTAGTKTRRTMNEKIRKRTHKSE
jgi:hypothetical protein